MVFNLILHEGTDSIKFGMSHGQIQSIIGKKPTLFQKSKFDNDMTEDYSGVCHVYYEGTECVSFEFFAPSQVFYNDVQLLGQERTYIETLLSGLDGYIGASDMFSYYNGDLGFYTPNGKIESVSISCEGLAAKQREYYEKCFEKEFGQFK